ncbi:MAG TPA: ornithine cyclodeaminase family protein [Nocardioidaceae bacterium]|nr:ornithine cyclodeaminase family protein [Nocardioidaceae bacterium]
MDLPFVPASAMSDLCTTRDAVDALEASLRGGFDPEDDLQRTGAALPAGQFLMMPSALGELAGLKLVSLAPGNPALGRPFVQAIYVLMDGETLTPLATFDGTYLTTLRTAAVSALAARHMARSDASRLAVFGAGVQAWAHVQSFADVLPLRHVDVVGRDTSRATALTQRIRDELGISASPATADAVADADLVACCTTSRAPLFDGSLLKPEATVVAIGAYEPDARELDDTTMARGVVVVESLVSALREAGDVIQAIKAGALEQQELQTLRSLVLGEVTFPEDVVRVFKGTGMSWQDLSVAGLLHSRLSL